MRPEVYFLKYAFPCAFVILQRGKISQHEYEELERAAVTGVLVDREKLEKIFVKAFKRMKVLAVEMGVDMWSRELMQEYFWNRHNQIIDAGEGSYAHAPEILKELCRILPAKVEKVVGDNVVVRFENGKTRPVSIDLVGVLASGDRVMVHYGYAVEVVSS